MLGMLMAPLMLRWHVNSSPADRYTGSTSDFTESPTITKRAGSTR